MAADEALAPSERGAARRTASILTPSPVCVEAEASLDRAIELMEAHGFRHLLVLRDGRLAGLLSDREVLAATGWLPQRVHESRGACRTAGHPCRVGQVMRAPIAPVTPDTRVAEVTRRLLREELGCVPVLDGERLVGVVTETDLLRAYLEERRGPGPALDDPPLEELMSVEPVTVHWYTTLAEACRLCREHGLRHLPVLESGLLVGMLSDRDLQRARGLGRADETPIDEVVSRAVVSGTRALRASDAAELLLRHKIGALPITEEGEVRGIVTSTDLLRHDLATRAASASHR